MTSLLGLYYMCQLEEKNCSSVRDFLEFLPENEEAGGAYFYRGHNNKNHRLCPSIYRRNDWISNEDRFIREVILRCPAEFQSMWSSFEKLVKMQHYGVPTRLLDVSQNPLVALYFACETDKDNPDSDAEVVIFKVPNNSIKYFDSDTVSVISNIAWVPSDFQIHTRHKHSPKNFHDNNPYATKLMHEIRREKPHFLELIKPQDLESVVCVIPQINNPRISRQDGAFFLFGIDGNKLTPAVVKTEWVFGSQKCIIKSADKAKIKKELSKLGVSKEKLFPEIDRVADYIKSEIEWEEKEFHSTEKKPASSVTFSR